MGKKESVLSGSAILLLAVLFVTGSCKKDNNTSSALTVADIDGNIYHTVTIGTQVWMAENLKVTRYRNGDSIPCVTDSLTWSNLTTGACCDYGNIPGNSIVYGKLYNWYAVNDSCSIAPQGWHIPSATEWQTLVNYLGGNGIAGGKLKETDTFYWWKPNDGATNVSGFTALPAGLRHAANGQYMSLGELTMLWSSSRIDADGASDLYLSYWSAETSIAYTNLRMGLSVRCVKD
ncbi:MAG TPA: fibrobacter succinogenes major paralogous domain-containing protein [Bacteroidales bacterium]|nr:fibrobacter succinogenes major paralogous domain-containing protein [Bacteroidales bacterium]